MKMQLMLTVFTTVFLAEIGDKTQLSTMLYASDPQNSKWIIFFAASLALVVASALGILAGTFLSELISPKYLGRIAGIGFIIVGIWTFLKN